MADLTVQEADAVTVFQEAASGGDRYPNDGTVHLRVRNIGGVDRTVTFKGKTRVPDHPDLPLIDRPLTAPAVSTITFPSASPRWFNDTDGYVNVEYDSAVGVQVAAVRQGNER